MSAPGEIVVVCTANICRSPMGAALLQHALMAEAEPLKSWKVISAGVVARRGDPVSANSIAALKKVGLDVSQHRSQPVTQEMLDRARIVLCMTESHRAMLHVQADPLPRHVHLFRDFMPGEVDREIGDPFGGPLRLYEAVRDEMVEAIPSLMKQFRSLAA